MNRSELDAAVKSFLNRPNLGETELSVMVSSVEGELNRALRDHPRNQRRASFAMQESDGTLPLPVDVASLVTLRNADMVRYDQYPPAVVPDLGFIERGDCLQVYPVPEVGDMFYLDYTSFLRPMVEPADTNWVSTYYSDVYLYGCLKEAAVFLKDTEKFQLWQTEFLRRVEGVRLQGWNQNVADSPVTRNGG